MADKKLPHKVKAPVKKAAASPRRQSARLTAKTKFTADEDKNSSAPLQELAGGFMQRLDAISRKLSQLALHKPEEAIEIPASSSKDKSVETKAASSVDSDKTLIARYPIVECKEKEMCRKLFSPLKAVPNRETLQSVLTANPVVKIPIHQHTFSWLQEHVEEDKLKGVFDIVEEVGNICPKLTPRVEAALHVNVPRDVTEGMQQCALDAFLMGVIGTAQEYIAISTKVDRNANELSMTKFMCRPDYLLMFNGQLVFKGEEKKSGDARNIALELTEKMIPGSVGKDGKLEYMIGYATAGSSILFECIYGDEKMSECSQILDIERVADRVTLILILINVKSTVPTNVISYKNKGYSAPPEELDRVKQRVDGTIRRLLILELNKPKEAIGIPTSGRENKPVEDKAGSSVDSDKTLVRYPVVNSKEEICHKLFSPLGAVPNRETLQSVLAENPAKWTIFVQN
ncbi:hypothetical protein IWW40_003188 [Coemansia sp. RSA 1250]|nr:hypothetical protein IWW40_003188 [Coemansia sp. RSA 1250]